MRARRFPTRFDDRQTALRHRGICFNGRIAGCASHFGMSLLLGFIALICVPVAALVFLIKLIGIPLGLMTIALYLVLLVVGYVSSGISLGEWMLKRMKGSQGITTLWRIGAAMTGVLVVALLARIPWIGGWIAFAALLAGLGALALSVGRQQQATLPLG